MSRSPLASSLQETPNPTHMDISNHIHLAKEHKQHIKHGKAMDTPSSFGYSYHVTSNHPPQVLTQRITTNLPALPALITAMVCFRNHVPICDLKALRLSHWFYRKKEDVQKRYGYTISLIDTTYRDNTV